MLPFLVLVEEQVFHQLTDLVNTAKSIFEITGFVLAQKAGFDLVAGRDAIGKVKKLLTKNKADDQRMIFFKSGKGDGSEVRA